MGEQLASHISGNAGQQALVENPSEAAAAEAEEQADAEEAEEEAVDDTMAMEGVEEAARALSHFGSSSLLNKRL